MGVSNLYYVNVRDTLLYKNAAKSLLTWAHSNVIKCENSCS